MPFSETHQPRYAVYTDDGILVARYGSLARALTVQAEYYERGIGTHVDVTMRRTWLQFMWGV